jgi:hypothetical protein
MNKPGKKTVTHYDYHDIIKYIEDKYSIESRDYYGCHGSKNGQPWEGKMKPGYIGGPPTPPYADFWHWMLDQNSHLTNGSYIYFPEDWKELEVSNDPKVRGCNYIPRFAKEIMILIEAEFGTKIYMERIWVEW